MGTIGSLDARSTGVSNGVKIGAFDPVSVAVTTIFGTRVNVKVNRGRLVA